MKVTWENWEIKYLGEELNKFSKFEFDYSKDSWDEPKGILVSIEKHGQTNIFWEESNLMDSIVLGEAIFDKNLNKKIPEYRFPFGGIHFNCDDNEMYFWYFSPVPKICDWAKTYWKTWKLDYKFSGFRKHFELANISNNMNRVIKELEEVAIQKLKELIVNSDQEPFIRIENDRNVYDFKDRLIEKKAREYIFNLALGKLKI